MIIEVIRTINEDMLNSVSENMEHRVNHVIRQESSHCEQLINLKKSLNWTFCVSLSFSYNKQSNHKFFAI